MGGSRICSRLRAHRIRRFGAPERARRDLVGASRASGCAASSAGTQALGELSAQSSSSEQAHRSSAGRGVGPRGTPRALGVPIESSSLTAPEAEREGRSAWRARSAVHFVGSSDGQVERDRVSEMSAQSKRARLAVPRTVRASSSWFVPQPQGLLEREVRRAGSSTRSRRARRARITSRCGCTNASLVASAVAPRDGPERALVRARRTPEVKRRHDGGKVSAQSNARVDLERMYGFDERALSSRHSVTVRR